VVNSDEVTAVDTDYLKSTKETQKKLEYKPHKKKNGGQDNG